MSATRLDTDALTTALADLNAFGQGDWSLSGGAVVQDLRLLPTSCAPSAS
ncbi:MAG: hypothetical protein MZV65_50155 [Chromatiales bacterium]|nr:hypothetical protein [Chromatiales bacterium]